MWFWVATQAAIMLLLLTMSMPFKVWSYGTSDILQHDTSLLLLALMRGIIARMSMTASCTSKQPCKLARPIAHYMMGT